MNKTQNTRNVIELKEVVKEFGDKVVLENINLKIKKGEFVTLLGPSGSGKTTILRLIAGFERATRGEIKFNDRDIKDLPPHKRDLSTIFQDYALFPHLNVEGNIKYGLSLKRIPKDTINPKHEALLEQKIKVWDKKAKQEMAKLDSLQKKYESEMQKLKTNSLPYKRRRKWLDRSDFNYSYWENYVDMKKENFEKAYLTRKISKEEMNAEVAKIVELVGLKGSETKAINELSGGMKQRVALARSLVIEPTILLLDEPLSALDAKIREKMQKLLRSLQQSLGITFIFVTHDQDEALELSDRIAIMRDGVIEQYDTPKQIYDYPVNKWVANFVGDSNIYSAKFNEDATVTFMDKTFKTVHDEDEFEQNSQVDVLIRPEDVDIMYADETRKKTGIIGKIEEMSYRGSYYYLKVVFKNGYHIFVETAKKFEEGAKVSISWTIDSIHIMAKDAKWDYSNDEF
ncbi:ABC transporter ATP-binding protein [Mycoplasma sp. ES3225-GEN-MYC]|uniref:ABC transporter ATP-binding protein n=1 Tax=Mycoplasma miroungigenitalium TaxID=754515 RepID=UPI001C1164F4|nr:ABC transporter ATP-binding protein [Mycoplasma miroungigenitalium]MBU4691843.1 ABC transporter ATP-binding protein [Mycoplasma miroungigenitalium]